MRVNRRNLNRKQRDDFDLLSKWAKIILTRWFREDGKRHSKTVVTFSADRFVITDIEVHNRKKGGTK